MTDRQKYGRKPEGEYSDRKRKQENGYFPAVWQSLPGILRMFDVDSYLKGCYTYG